MAILAPLQVEHESSSRLARPGADPYALRLAIAGLAIHLALLFAFPYLPLVDLPNHMARVWLAGQALAGAELPPFYHIDYRVLPNLGIDLIAPLLLQVMDLDSATRLTLAVVVFVYWLGPTLFLLGQVNRARNLAAFWTVWLFTGAFFWGFINFTLGQGVAFLALAHHDCLMRKTAPRWPHLVLHACLVTWLFFCHLVAWGVYGLLLGCKLLWLTHEAKAAARNPSLAAARDTHRPRCARLWGQAAVCALPSLVLLVIYRLSLSGVHPLEIEWSPLTQKWLRPLVFFRGYIALADVATLFLWLFALAMLVLPFRGICRHWTHLALAVLGFLFVFMPNRVGNGADFDLRLLPSMVVLLLAALQALPAEEAARRLPRPGAWRARVALALLSLAIVLRVGSIAVAWGRLSARLTSEAESFAVLRVGDRVATILAFGERTKEHVEDHFLCWTVPSHRTLVPNLFAYGDLQPLRYAAAWEACRRPLIEPDGSGGFRLNAENVRRFNVLWVVNPERRGVEVPAGYHLVWFGGDVSVYRQE